MLDGGAVEFHAAAESYPILNGARRIVGTVAVVVRCTEGQEASPC